MPTIRPGTCITAAVLAAGTFATSMLLLSAAAEAHGPASPAYAPAPEREIQFPNTAERLTLAVDLHTHSVFSDGHVWPRIRVGEAEYPCHQHVLPA
ncbi:MAG: hypothetical protein ACC642_12090, partial [Pseudomonadales bacterium]